MKIEPGARIGPYEIVSLLGQGGMGAVWRARHVVLRREDAGAKWQVSPAGGVAPRWSADGREIYYLAPDGSLMAVPIAMERNQPSAGKPVALFQTRIKGGGTSPNDQQYDVARDGRFLINVVNTDDAPITVIQNWSPPGADGR